MREKEGRKERGRAERERYYHNGCRITTGSIYIKRIIREYYVSNFMPRDFNNLDEVEKTS